MKRRKRKMNMKQTTLITIIMVALVFTGCKSDSDPKCDCPNGTVHLAGETCCNYDDCVCEKGFVSGKRVQGIAVTKGEGLSDTDFDKAVKVVEEALDMFKSSENGQYAYMLPIIKKHIAEIRIIPGIQTVIPSVTLENGRYILILKNECLSQDIWAALYDFVVDHPELK